MFNKKNKEEKEEKKEESKIFYKHYLSCVKCRFQFSIETKESNNTKIGFDKMKCPLCSKAIQLDPSMLNVSGKRSMENQSKMNAEASREAIKLAGEQKEIDRTTGEEDVAITSYQDGSQGKTERIPKKVIESIEEKISPIISE